MERRYGDRLFFQCWPLESVDDLIGKGISEIISNYFFLYEERDIIHQLIHKQYHSSYPEDADDIEKRIYQLLTGHAQKEYEAEKIWFRNQIHLFLSENNHLAMDGYFRFRTKPHQQWLSKYVQEAIDEYLLDREYKEFIELLKYFVSIQQSKFVRVHVIHKAKKNFQLLKEDGRPIQVNELDGTFHELIGHSFSGEDFIVGALLSTAPEEVILHTNAPEENVIRTLMQIFDERIILCKGCKRCLMQDKN